MPAYKKIDASTDVGKRTLRGLKTLRHELDNGEFKIPAKTVDPTLLLATWNIREFGRYANTGDPKGDGRDQEALFYIAEIISRFDIVALQEVQGNLDSLDELIGILGNWWKYIVSDSSLGTLGGSERHAYIYDSRKVVFGGMAGEVVPEPEKEIVKVRDQNGNQIYENGKPKEKVLLKSFAFARTPFIAGFRAGWFKFTICTQHFNYGEGENDPQRVEEATQIARILSNRISKKTEEAWAHNTILLGDFNVFDREEDETFVVIEKMKFKIPMELRLDTNTNRNAPKPFDQIAFLSCDEVWKMDQLKAGTFPFFDYVYCDGEHCTTYGFKETESELYQKWRTYKMSDHQPLWVELRIDFGDEYLEAKMKSAIKELADDFQEPVG